MVSRADENIPVMVLESIFKQYDTDGSGVINQKELHGLLYDLGIHVPLKDLPHVYAMINSDGKGGVDFDDLCRWWRKESKFARFTKEQLTFITQCSRYFSFFDTDRSGSISASELPALYRDLAKNNLIPPGVSMNDAWKALDEDKNGVISLNEFIEWMETSAYRK